MIDIPTTAEEHGIDENALTEYYLNSPEYFDQAGAETLVESFEDSYCGYYDSHEDFILEYLCIADSYELPDFILNNFDYTQYWLSELRHYYWESDGYYFSNH